MCIRHRRRPQPQQESGDLAGSRVSPASQKPSWRDQGRYGKAWAEGSGLGWEKNARAQK